MLQPREPNRVPKSTYDSLKKDYEELELYVKNRIWEREFFRKQERWRKFQIVSSIALMVIWFIIILVGLFK